MTDHPKPKVNPFPNVGLAGRPSRWILKDRIAYPCDDLYEWGRWFETGDRRVAFDEIETVGAVSTVFLGLDHAHTLDPTAPPILFETLVFLEEGGTGSMLRYSLYDEAVKGHQLVLRTIKAEIEHARAISIDSLVNIMVNTRNG
jgi:hypothetical protein